jgi:hypothetical protein
VAVETTLRTTAAIEEAALAGKTGLERLDHRPPAVGRRLLPEEVELGGAGLGDRDPSLSGTFCEPTARSGMPVPRATVPRTTEAMPAALRREDLDPGGDKPEDTSERGARGQRRETRGSWGRRGRGRGRIGGGSLTSTPRGPPWM